MGREATRAVSGGRPSVAEALRAHASVICLQHPSLPPHSATEQVSLTKQKKNSVLNRPLCVRAETRHWRDQQTEEAITQGNALEATGHRLKPCGYYWLHRKGPIDLEKYKSDQGTSQKWTEPTILTTKPETVLDIFLLFLRSFFLFFNSKKNFLSPLLSFNFHFYNLLLCKKKKKDHFFFFFSNLHIYIL